jgi:hypothetical protein
MDAGTAHGITDGAEFAVYKDRQISPELSPLGTLLVHDTRAFLATLDVVPGTNRFALEEPAFALQTKTGVEQDLRLHIAIDEKLIDVFRALAKDMQSPGPDHRRILLVDKEDAEFDVALEDGQIVFNILDTLVAKFGLTRLPVSVSPNVDSVYPVIRAAAHYRRHLRRSNKKAIFQNSVRVEFRQLSLSREPYGTDLNINGIIDIVVDEEVMYGIKIINNTTKPLFPWLFYFDNSDLSISA